MSVQAGVYCIQDGTGNWGGGSCLFFLRGGFGLVWFGEGCEANKVLQVVNI